MDEVSVKGLSIILGILKKPLEWVTEKYQRSKNAAHDYGKHYRKRHGHLKFSFLEMQAPISLEDVYVAVRFLEKKEVSQYGSFENVEKEFREGTKKESEGNSDERQYGMVVANDEQYLMVLGSPGVGKSTFLRKVGLEVLKRKGGNFQHECIPVFLELKKFTENSVDIEALITHEFEVCCYPYPERMTKDTLKSGKLLVLLDGLDETPIANVDNVISNIGDFVNQYSHNRFIVSCRTAMNIRGFTQFTNVEVAEFDDLQIERYINNWFATTSNKLMQQLDNKVTTADLCWGMLNMTEHQATKELVRNPLLLALLCVVYDKLETFPLNRIDLYKRVLDILLKKWPDEKYISRNSSVSQYLNIWDEEQLFSEIAAKNFEEDCLLFEEKELVDQIQKFSERNSIKLSKVDSYKLLKAIAVEQGVFVERVSGVYSFPHLTFQEYLTANYFVSTQSIQKLVTEHLHDERWREVFLFAAELMSEADSLLLEMETEAAKVINTDGLKALFQWAKRITNPSDIQGNRIAKPTFAVRQFFSLWIFNKINEKVKDINNRYPNLKIECKSRSYLEYLSQKHDSDQEYDQESSYTRKMSPDIYRNLHKYLDKERDADICQDLNIYQNLNRPLYQNLHFDPDIILYTNQALHGEDSSEFYKGYDFYRPLHQNLHYDIYEILHPDYNQDFKLYIYLYLYLFQELDYIFNNQYFNLTLDLYHDLYRYIELDCYTHIFIKFGNRFEKELDKRISFIEYMDDAKIFKGVNLQNVLLQINEQRKLIKTVREGKSVNPPEKSIHDTWVSVLGITDDMLAISPQEMLSYIWYLRAMKLMFECKKVACHVSPDIWQEIEDRLLVTDF